MEHHPIRFSFSLESGKVPLPKPPDMGLFSQTLSLVTGEDDDSGPEMEDRNFFDEITAQGRLFFHPHLTGWVTSGVSTLELVNAKGPASSAGVTINGGVLDSDLRVTFGEEGDMEVKSLFVFEDLSMSEPSDGFISGYLSLPAPLDSVIFLLRDEEGVVEVPINFQLEEGGLSAAEISQTALTLLGSLIADAVASSPFRLVGGVVDMIPLGGEEESEEEALVQVTFDPGDSYVARMGENLLEPLIERLEEKENLQVNLEHGLGKGDLACVRLRANPSKEDCLELTARLKNQRTGLQNERTRTAGKLRAYMEAGLTDRIREARLRLQVLDRELALMERALDRVLDLLRPGAERRAGRRLRQACMELGFARLLQVRDTLIATGIPGMENRIRLKRPQFNEPAPLSSMTAPPQSD